MATTATGVQQTVAPKLTETEFSWYQRLILRRAHPRSLFINGTAFIWFCYFIFNQDWITALSAVVIGRVLAFLSVMHIDVDHMGDTALGKVALLHLHPMNLTTQLVGALVLVYGIWEHSLEFALMGISVVLVGHLFGWSRVNPMYADKDEVV